MRVALVKMPTERRTQSDSPFKSFASSVLLGIASWSEHRTDVRIENQQHATVVFARKFAHHQRARARRSFPVHMAHAIVGDVAAQRIQILAASLRQTLQRAVQSRQNFN